MRPKQDSITIKFHQNTELRDQLYRYLLENPANSQNRLLNEILANGLAVVTGQYHDQELGVIQEQLASLIRNAELNNQTLHNVNEGLADVQDAITDQYSDVDLLIEPQTKTTTQRHNQKAGQSWQSSIKPCKNFI